MIWYSLTEYHRITKSFICMSSSDKQGAIDGLQKIICSFVEFSAIRKTAEIIFSCMTSIA